MQVPFTVSVEALRRLGLSRPARTWWAWAVVGAIAAAVVSSLGVWRWSAQGAAGEANAALQVTSIPPGAVVEVDGRAGALTPADLTLAPGEHRVTVRREGYTDATYRVSAQPGQTGIVAADLWLRTPLAQRLRPTFPGATIADADFLADGRVALTLTLPPGDEQQLWLIDTRGEARRLGPPDARGSLAVTPDGARVAYLARGEGVRPGGAGLDEVWLSNQAGDWGVRSYVLPTASNGERLVDLSWAPDGQHLLVVSREPRAGGGLRTHLRWLDPTTGEASELTTIPSEVVPSSYSWRPDSQWVAFLARADQATSLCLLGTPSGEFRYLADLGRDDSGPLPFAPLAWAPDGERVVYSAPAQDRSGPPSWLFRGSPPLTLYAADLSEAASRRLTDAPGQSPTWRLDGSIVALDRPKWDGDILLRAVDPSGDARELGPLPVEAAATYAVRWDVPHAQAIVAVRRTGLVGGSGPSYWLVGFRAEGDR